MSFPKGLHNVFLDRASGNVANWDVVGPPHFRSRSRVSSWPRMGWSTSRWPTSRTVSRRKHWLQSFQKADQQMRENTKLVYEQGFAPTGAHKRAYKEMQRNVEAIDSALRQRRDFIQRSSEFFKNGVPSFKSFTIEISQPKKSPILSFFTLFLPAFREGHTLLSWISARSPNSRCKDTLLRCPSAWPDT